MAIGHWSWFAMVSLASGLICRTSRRRIASILGSLASPVAGRSIRIGGKLVNGKPLQSRAPHRPALRIAAEMSLPLAALRHTASASKFHPQIGVLRVTLRA